MKELKCPRPPRELCNSFLDWMLGIVSPSLIMKESWNPSKDVKGYLDALNRYEFYLLKQKIDKRTANKEEWKSYIRKIGARQIHCDG